MREIQMTQILTFSPVISYIFCALELTLEAFWENESKNNEMKSIITWKFWCKDGIYGSWRIVLHEWENGCWESPTGWKSYHKSCRHKAVPLCAYACGFSWISSQWTWKIYWVFHTYSSSPYIKKPKLILICCSPLMACFAFPRFFPSVWPHVTS